MYDIVEFWNCYMEGHAPVITDSHPTNNVVDTRLQVVTVVMIMCFAALFSAVT